MKIKRVFKNGLDTNEKQSNPNVHVKQEEGFEKNNVIFIGTFHTLPWKWLFAKIKIENKSIERKIKNIQPKAFKIS